MFYPVGEAEYIEGVKKLPGEEMFDIDSATNSKDLFPIMTFLDRVRFFDCPLSFTASSVPGEHKYRRLIVPARESIKPNNQS